VKRDTRLVGDNNNKGCARSIAPNPAREAGTTIIEKINNLQRTEAREVGET
jgi:hypothetical protein